MPRRVRVEHGDVFPLGAFVKGKVKPVLDFDQSTKERPVQAVDVDRNGEGSGWPVWQVMVLDLDEDAGKKDTAVMVKIAAKVQPVPPKNDGSFPLTRVEFVGLTALPYVDEGGGRARIVWSYRAEGMVAPGTGAAASAASAGSAGSVASKGAVGGER